MNLVTSWSDKNMIIMVDIDNFSQYAELIALRKQTCPHYRSSLVICNHGLCSEMHSDHGREFDSNVLTAVSTMLRVTKTRTCPYRPHRIVNA